LTVEGEEGQSPIGHCGRAYRRRPGVFPAQKAEIGPFPRRAGRKGCYGRILMLCLLGVGLL
jgi:hypothetical protein